MTPDTDMEQKVHELTKKVESLSKQIEELIEAWRTAKGIVAFVKWLGGLAIAGSAILALIKLGGSPK